MSFEQKLARQWRAETSGEVALKGSSEEREVANQYSIRQQLEFRLNPAYRFQAFAAYRVKRYSDDAGRNAIDPYVGGRFEQRFNGGRSWNINYRYDKNRSQDPRRRYIRWTYGAEFVTPVINRQNLLSLEVKYRPQLYARLVRVDGKRVPRRDQRWLVSADWERALKDDLRLTLSYRFERRASNDPDKKFNEHLLGLTFNFKWWK